MLSDACGDVIVIIDRWLHAGPETSRRRRIEASKSEAQGQSNHRNLDARVWIVYGEAHRLVRLAKPTCQRILEADLPASWPITYAEDMLTGTLGRYAMVSWHDG